MSRKPTQLERVLDASRRFNGVCQHDFNLPETCDGLPPISRVAARIEELEKRRDCTFEILPYRKGFKVYRLVDAPRDTAPPATGGPRATPQPGCVSQSAEDTLFENTAEPIPHWKSEAA